MQQEFHGNAAPFTQTAIRAAADRLKCPVAALRAVIDVESRGGFQRDGRPKILFERHYFRRLTGGRYDVAHPDISARNWGGYGRSSAQYDRLHRAIALDRDAALRSASWGAFQIMGDNSAAAGFADVEAFVAAMVEGEDRHLDAFVDFVLANSLNDELRRCDWAGFARDYNGSAYRRNRYDTKLAAAYARHAAAERPVLRVGDRGQALRDVQVMLGITADGVFGPLTERAVRQWQRDFDLVEDGIVGPLTWDALDK